jgi:hypothetical protein
MPAIVATHRNSANSNSDATNYNSGAVALTIGRVAYVACVSRLAAGPSAAATVTSASNTWTEVGTVAVGVIRLTVARCAVASATSEVINAAYGEETQEAHAFMIFEVANLSTGAPVQSKTNSSASATSLTVTFDDPFASPWNATLGIFGWSAASGTLFISSNLDQLLIDETQSAASEGACLGVTFSPKELAAVTGGVNSGAVVGLALELSHDGSDLGGGGARRSNILGL